MPRVFDLIKPLDNRDTYAITDVLFQKGGLREVQDVASMHAITEERRRSGMIVFIIETGEFFSLGSELKNTSWQKIDFSNNVSGKINIPELAIRENNNSIFNQEGENLSLDVSNTSVLKIKNGQSLVSLIENNQQDGKIVFLQNMCDHDLIIKNNYLYYSNKYVNVLNNKDGIKQIVTNDQISIAISSGGYLLKNENSNNWDNIPNIDNNSWQSIVYANNKFVCVSNSGLERLIFSSDGINWTKVIIQNQEWIKIIYNNNLFFLLSNNKIAYSSDLLEWAYIDIVSNTWKDVVYGNNTFVIVGDTISSTNAIIYSDNNGINWTISSKPNSNNLLKVKFIKDKFYAISNFDILFSENGINWEQLFLPFDSSNIKDILYINNYFIFFKNNKVYYTDDLENWKNFSFDNHKDIINTYFFNDYIYLLMDDEINKLYLDIKLNNYQFLTGTNFDLIFLKKSSIIAQFSKSENVWRIIGGMSLNPIFRNLMDVPQNYPQVQINNNLFLSINPNLNEEEKIIYNNPFPVNEDENDNLMITAINGIKIRKFDNQTGRIVFANKFIPTISSIKDQVLNFDDSINSIEIIVINDRFVTDVKLNSINSVFYYKNNETENLIQALPIDPVLPYLNNDFEWSKKIFFETIGDINDDFSLNPNSFTLKINLVATNGELFDVKKNIQYNVPDFDFSIEDVTRDFRQIINNCKIDFTYKNVTNKNINSSISSIISDIPNVIFDNFINGMNDYEGKNLGIYSSSIAKTNNMFDTATFTFAIKCRYTRPLEIDSDQNFYEIEKIKNFNIKFVYPIFTGPTPIGKVLIENNDIMLLSNSDDDDFPRIFNSFSSTNINWWFCVRKNYVNNRTPIVTLLNNGLSIETNIVYQNDVDITYSSNSETYIAYGITLQANIDYTIKIVFR